jgi:hypothetical protein
MPFYTSQKKNMNILGEAQELIPSHTDSCYE